MAKSKVEPTFEEALAELEGIVNQMEGGQLSLEASLTAYSRGAALLRQCQSQLQEAQHKVQQLNAEGQLQPFELNDDAR